mgnify:CR=1 FL=1
MARRIIPDVVKEQQICMLPETSTALEAAKEMFDRNVAALIVVDDEGSLKGILTERDMTRRVLAKDRDSSETKLSDIMTREPDTLSPKDTAVQALELMRKHNYRHIPVVDGNQVVGMVSIRDLYAIVHVELEENIRETEAFVFGDRYGA